MFKSFFPASSSCSLEISSHRCYRKVLHASTLTPIFAPFRPRNFNVRQRSNSLDQLCGKRRYPTMADLSVELTAPNGRKYVQPTGLFINNEWVGGSGGEMISSINPSYVSSLCLVRGFRASHFANLIFSRPCKIILVAS